MGITVSVETNPRKWKELECNAIFFSKTKSPCEDIHKFRVGEADYDFQGCWDIEICIRDSVYQKLLSNEYLVDIDGNGDVIIKDKNGNIIPPFSRGEGPTIL